jgi:hypothetical protein
MLRVNVSTICYEIHLQFFFLMIIIDTISIASSAPLLKYYYIIQLCYDYNTITYNLIKIHIH